jgi:hypothetical protein
MSNKLKKGHKPPKRQSPKSSSKALNSPTRTERRMSGQTVLAILAIVIAAVGLVALRPQLSVSMEEPLDPAQPYSPTFRVTNSGLLAIPDIQVYCYADKFEFPGNNTFNEILLSNNWTSSVLERGESQSIVCTMLHTNIQPQSFDIALVVEQAYMEFRFLRE